MFWLVIRFLPSRGTCRTLVGVNWRGWRIIGWFEFNRSEEPLGLRLNGCLMTSGPSSNTATVPNPGVPTGGDGANPSQVGTFSALLPHWFPWLGRLCRSLHRFGSHLNDSNSGASLLLAKKADTPKIKTKSQRFCSTSFP